MQYAPTTGYVWPFKKLSCFRPLRGRLWGRMRYAPTIGYVRSFEIPMQFSNWVHARVQKMDLYTPPSVAYGGAYAIRPYNWVRAILRNTDAIFQLNTCGPSKNCPVFVPLRGRGVGVCDTPLQLGTCEGSKNGSVYATVGGVWWGVCDTPLRLDTCDSSKYRYDLSTGGAGAFGRWGGGGYRLRGRRA